MSRNSSGRKSQLSSATPPIPAHVPPRATVASKDNPVAKAESTAARDALPARHPNADTPTLAPSWRSVCLQGALAGLAPVLVAILGYWFMPGFSLGFDDSVSSYQPMVSQTFTQCWQGKVPLWSDALGCGTPHYALGLSFVFYPGNFIAHGLCLLFNLGQREVEVNHLLHIFLGTAASYVYLRRNDCRILAALIGCWGFAFAGPLWGFWCNWNSYAYMQGLLPVSLVILDTLFTSKPGWNHFLATTLCWGTLCQMGDPQLLIKFTVFIGLYALLRLPLAHPGRAVLVMLSGAACGALLGLIQLLAFVLHIGLGSRGETMGNWGMVMPLQVDAFWGLANPLWRGEMEPSFIPRYFGLYGGPLLMLLPATLGLAKWWRTPVARALLILLVLTFLFSLGGVVPTNRWAVHIPIINRMRWPVRWSLEITTAAGLLTGLIAEHAFRARLNPVARGGMLLGLTWLTLSLFVVFPADLQPFSAPWTDLCRIALLATSAVLVWLLWTGNPWFFRVGVAFTLCTGLIVVPLAQRNRFSKPDLLAWRMAPELIPDLGYERVLPLVANEHQRGVTKRANYFFNLPSQYGGRAVYGYIYPFFWQENRFAGVTIQGVAGDMPLVRGLYLDPKNKGLLKLLRVGAVMVAAQDTFSQEMLSKHPDFAPGESNGETVVFRHRGFREPAWFAKNLVIFQQQLEAQEISLLDPEEFAVVFEPDTQQPNAKIAFTPGKVRRYAEDNGHIEVDLEAEKEGYLLLNTTWHPDWQARVDGKLLPLAKTQGGMMGIYIPAGSQQLVIDFLPPWRHGVIPSVCLYWAILGVWLFRITRQPNAARPAA